MMKQLVFSLTLTLLSGCTTQWAHLIHEPSQAIIDIERCEREAYAATAEKDVFEIVDFSRYRLNPHDFLYEDDDDFIEQRRYVSECLTELGYQRDSGHSK
ncbi:MAG: hypothetical protein HOD58_06500 [Gammaproteobacteria bacterium]|jgi:hypothetical protein|nr:hypothetical protein [Candidatus Neomarinimicrobiota bacterium]MBT4329559.1 hypothetical protein [Gammaproteobacteria bacterium]MBT4606969.1 hypothetical protein [Thiotrichales bacterium]